MRQRQTETDKDKQRQTETDTDRERQRETDKHRQTQTETDRARQRETETDRDRRRQTETDRDRQNGRFWRPVGYRFFVGWNILSVFWWSKICLCSEHIFLFWVEQILFARNKISVFEEQIYLLDVFIGNKNHFCFVFVMFLKQNFVPRFRSQPSKISFRIFVPNFVQKLRSNP